MNSAVIVEADSVSFANPKELEILMILSEIRDYLLTETSSLNSTSNRDEIKSTTFRSRLLEVATPQETMNIIVPHLFQNPSDSENRNSTSTDTKTKTPSFNSVDALQILGFLVSSHIDIIETSQQEQQRPLFLIAASKGIKNELCKRLAIPSPISTTLNLVTSESTPSDVALYVSNELIRVLVHQACTGLDMEVSQNCHDSILLLFQYTKASSSSIRSLTLEGIVSVWLNAITSVVDETKKKSVRSEFGTICVRCTTLIVDIILLNDTRTMELLFLEATPTDPFHVGNILCSLLTDLPDDDTLLQISIYDVLCKLASERPNHPIRTQWLFQDAFIQPLLRKVGVGSCSLGEESHEPDAYLGSSALNILIAISSMLTDASIGNETEVFIIGETLIRDLHTALRNFEITGNDLERLSYIDAISSLASTSPAALHMILDDPITCEGWLLLNVAQPKIKAAILVSIANVLDHPKAISDGRASNTPLLSSSTTVSNETCMKLFSTLGRVNGRSSGYNHSDTTELLLKLVKSPIHEIRFGVYRLFEAISKYSMGGQVLMTNSNFYTNFLTQRDTIETTYEGRILKFNIVQALHANGSLKQLLSNDVITQLEQYLSQGPHYRKALQWEVMTMEQ